jgi:hypothetical protein
MKHPDLPRFNTYARLVPNPRLMAHNATQLAKARKRRIRNQRLGDIALGGLFMLVGFITVQMIAGIGR